MNGVGRPIPSSPRNFAASMEGLNFHAPDSARGGTAVAVDIRKSLARGRLNSSAHRDGFPIAISGTICGSLSFISESGDQGRPARADAHGTGMRLPFQV